MDEHKCYRCKHFTFKILLNGFHGICEKHRNYTMIDDSCGDFAEKDHKTAVNDKQTDKQTSWQDELITKGAAFKAVEDEMERRLKLFGYDSYEAADTKTQLVYDGMMHALTAIYGLPPSEAEIIRCNDCRWVTDSGMGCDILNDMFPGSSKLTWDDFCCMAERREDE